MKALAINSCETLESITVADESATQIIPLLTMCHHVSILQVGDHVTEVEIIGKEIIKSTLRTVKFEEDSMLFEIIEKIGPALKGVIDLKIECSDETILKIIIPT